MAQPALLARRPRIPRLFGPDRIYLGWHIAWIVFLSGGLTIGMTQYSFGVFAEPLESRFGWSRTEFNAALSFGFISGLLSPFVGRLMDKYGVRPILVVSLVSISAGFLLRPLISELWHWYLFHALVFAGMPGASVLASGKVVGMWFPATRGRMMGVVTAGNNFGGLTMVPLATLVLAVAGWEWAFTCFGIIMAFVALAALLIIRDGQEDLEAEAHRTGRAHMLTGAARAAARTGLTLSQAFRTRSFYMITIGLTAASFTYQGILTQIVPHLENEGFSTTAAAAALTMVAAMGIGSKLGFGRLSESITARRAAIICVALQTAGVGLMIAPGGAPMLWAGVFVFGLGFGGLGAMIVLSVSEAFGLYAFGAIMGMVNLAMILSMVGGPTADRSAIRRHGQLPSAVRHYHRHLRTGHRGAPGNQTPRANANPRAGHRQRTRRVAPTRTPPRSTSRSRGSARRAGTGPPPARPLSPCTPSTRRSPLPISRTGSRSPLPVCWS